MPLPARSPLTKREKISPPSNANAKTQRAPTKLYVKGNIFTYCAKGEHAGNIGARAIVIATKCNSLYSPLETGRQIRLYMRIRP